MKFSKFIVIPVLIAALAALVQIIDQLFQAGGNCEFFIANSGFGWLTFQAWACYFFAGCNIKGGLQVLVAYIAGIVGSILIIALGGWFAENGIGSFWATPLSLMILVIPVICLERVKVMIPALFVGAGAFFAIMTFQPEGATFISAAGTELIYCLVGLVFGWITVSLRVAYEKMVSSRP